MRRVDAGEVQAFTIGRRAGGTSDGKIINIVTIIDRAGDVVVAGVVAVAEDDRRAVVRRHGC